MTIKPPKCRTCGKEEYRHLCSGPVKRKVIETDVAAKSAPKLKSIPTKPKAN